MKKKLTLLIFLFPILINAQTTFQNGSIIFDMHPKKKQVDTTQQNQSDNNDDDDQPLKQKKEKKPKAPPEAPTSVQEDWRRDGLFQALFHAGMNACQVDGDGYAGYNYLGAEFGVGAMIRVHPMLSLSMMFNYSMEGAKESFKYDSALALSTTYTSSLQLYQVQFDYLQVPIALNIDAVTVKNRQIMFLSVGLAPGVLVRFKEIDEDGYNVTSNPSEGLPHRFDLSAFGGLSFVIHKNYVIGGKFQYSVTRIRGPNLNGLTRLLGEYNNDLSIDFMYILDTAKKNRKK